MKTWAKALLGIAFSFLFCFMCIGYATLSDTLSIAGSANAKPREGLYIFSAEVVSANNATSNEMSYFDPTNLMCDFTRTRNTGTITYEVTIFNNTAYKYSYSGIDYTKNLSGYNGNSLINSTRGITVTTKDNPDDTSATFNTADSVAPRELRTFYVTFSLGSNVTANSQYKTLINFKFGVNVDSVEDYMVDQTFELFQGILNDVGPGGGYETLVDIIDNKYDYGGPNNQWQATYIGNVNGSLYEDSQLVNELFGGQLSIKIDNVETSVTVLIKREDVDGNENTGDSYAIGSGSSYIHAEGCEMTLYLTTDALNVRGGTATVYAMVFTCDVYDDGSYGPWYMLGEMYEGKAPVIGYQGEDATGSFHTDTWVSTAKRYTVTETYSYNVGATDIKTVIQARDNNAINAFQGMLNRANMIIRTGGFAGQAMLKLQDVFNRASNYYTVANDGTVTVNRNVTRAQLVPFILEMESALKSFDGVA